MLFSKEITIPADTADDDPYTQRVKVSMGKVRRVWVLIPVPSAYCVGVQIWYEAHQMWPTSRTEWFIGGHAVIEFEENLEIDKPPLEFEVKCYNTDTENDHTVWVALSILRPTKASELEEFLALF